MFDPLEKGTWILVADGEKALFLRNTTNKRAPAFEVWREEHQENPPTREQATDRPGRYGTGGGGQRSAVQETDWHRLAKERFAEELAGILERRAKADAFRQLILVAPPALLGDLRAACGEEVARRIVGEVPKTLTKHPVQDIEKIVKEAVAPDL